MKKNHLNKLLCIIVVLLSIQLSNYGQLDQVGDLLVGGQQDAIKLTNAYLSPFVSSLGTSLGGGWYNTAKVHKPGGFDITITMNMSFISDENKTFDLSELGLNAQLENPANIKAPTLAGEKEAGPQINIMANDNTTTLASINTPQGLGVGLTFAPMVQASVGLIKGTEITLRYLPTLKVFNYGHVGLWGIGGKHSIKQWIPAVEKLPFLHITAQAGYTKMKLGTDLSLTPDDLDLDDNTSPKNWNDQQLNLEVSSFTANLLASINIPVLCIYGGIGFINSKGKLLMDGYYPVPDSNPSLDPQVNNDSRLKDLSIDIDKNTDPRLCIGLRLKFGPVTLHGDYTYATYSNVTAGLGVTFR